MNRYDDSSNPGPEWESELTRGLDQRVRDLHEAPFTLDQVKGRATTIQRRRRLAAAGGILAVAAVVLPIGIVAGRGLTGDDTRRPATPATTSPSPTEAVDGGSGLGLDYLSGSTWVRPDGTEVALGATYSSGTVLGEDLLAVRNDDETGQRVIDVIDVVDGSGEVSESIPLVSVMAVNDDRTTVAYVSPDGDLMTLWDPRAGDEGRVALASGLSESESPVAVLGGPSCLPDGDGCQVYVNHGDGRTPPQSVTSNGTTDEVVVSDPPPIGVTDATEGGLVTLQTSSQDAGSCGGLLDTRTSAYRWETCDRFLLDLSPAGTYVATTHAYLDGMGNAHVAILDTATEQELARLDPAEGVVTTQAWESEDALLVTVFASNSWSIWRLSADGTKERVVDPLTDGGDFSSPYTLLGGR